MISGDAGSSRCAEHVELYDQIVDLGDQAPMALLTRAQHICDGCSRALACSAGALARGEQWGMWGGVLMAGEEAEPTLDQQLGVRTGFEIGDLVEAIDSGELAGQPEVRRAAMVRLREELEIDAQRPAYQLRPNRHRSDPVSYARRSRGVPERIWVASMRAGVGARNTSAA